MTPDTQALLFNAAPLLFVGVLYLLVTAALVPGFWRERERLRDPELALALVFPAVGIGASVAGVALVLDPEPLGPSVWIWFAAILVAAFPPLVFLAHWRERALVLTASRRAREAEEQRAQRELERGAINAFTGDLARTDDVVAIGRLLTERVAALAAVEFASLTVVDGDEARGVYAFLDGAEAPFWRELRLDLREPSAIASAAFEAAPFTVFDVEGSPYVNQDIARTVGAKSGLWVPLVAGERVIGVLAAATTRERRAFAPADVTLLQELAAETALALERVRSAGALTEALARERLVARISQKVRSELDLDAVLDVAVAETAVALGVSRAFIRLGEAGSRMPIRAEWRGEGLEPVGERAHRLPVSNLAARVRETVVVQDVETAAELDDSALGDREVVRELGSRAVLATPIVVFDQVIGVFALHRDRPGPWSEDEMSLAEAVAHEVGIALHTSRLLAENDRRLRQQAALLEAAEALTRELDFDAVLGRLAGEVARVLDADAADCWLFDEARLTLRCRAVHGVPDENLGRAIPPEGTIGRAVATGRPQLKRDFAAVEQPPPSADYAGFAEVVDAPIVVDGEVHGVLGVCSRTDDRFREEDVEVLEAFANLAGIALRNARQFAERTRQARIQRGFYRVASVLGQPLSLAGTLDAVAQAASEALGGAFAAVLMPAAGTLELAGAQELPEPLRESLAAGLPASESALLTAAEEGRVLAAPHLATDERFDPTWRALAASCECRSLLAVPIRAVREDEGTGLVLVFFAEERAVDDDDLELAQHLAGAARGALQRSALFEEERAARSLAQQLARTGALLATELDPAAVLDEVVRQAPSLVGVEACAIRVLDGDELVVSAVVAEKDETLVGERSPATVRVSGDVIQSRAPLAIEDAAADERLREADPLLGRGYRGYLGVPLTAPEGAVHGVLAVYSRRPRAWRTDEIEALLALAANASAALSNAELYQRVALEKERSYAILSNIADGIVAIDRDGNVVLWNTAAEGITGVPADEALGRRPFQVLGRDLESDGGAPVGDRLVSILRGGEEVWLSLTEAVMRDPAGIVAGRIFAFRDISSERLVEEMKSEFVSTVSQELRRPLTSIYGFAETLLRRDVLFGEDERRTFLGYIASESERLTTIVDALLNVARLDAGDLQINLVPTDIGSVVSEVVANLDPAVGVNGHSFVVDLPDEPVAVEADPEKLRQVLTNLVDNAVKFSPQGGTVTVAARRNADTVAVSVADEGIGIPEAERDRIFRKFYRGDAGAGRESLGGTGLGLFIAQGLVAAMGGRIWVDSREGQGSSFTFELPAADAALPSVSESRAKRVGTAGS